MSEGERRENGAACVEAPPTVANVGPGFDVLAFAVGAPGDRVTARLSDTPGVHLRTVAGPAAGGVPTEAARNTAGVAAQRVVEAAGRTNVGVDIELHKVLRPASGLGSSAASAAAAAVAVNEVLGSPLDALALWRACREAERVSGGAPHGDNVAAALWGSFVAVDPGGDGVVVLPAPRGLWVAAVTPAVAVATAQARAVLPESVPLGDVTATAWNLARLVAALHSGDLSELGRALSGDRVHVQARSALVAGFDAVVDAALDSGAAGASIAGSGPTVFALCAGGAVARRVAGAMLAAFREATATSARALVAAVARRGALPDALRESSL